MAEDNVEEDFQNCKENVEINTVDGLEDSDDSSSSDDDSYELIQEVSNRTNRIKEHNEELENRFKLLKEELQLLKSKVKEENELWKLEVEEAMKYSNVESANECSNYQSSNSTSSDSLNVSYENDKNVMLYNDYNYYKTQAEIRENIRRQVALNNYQRQLLEVESMCNLELLRVKKNFQNLQPLRSMIQDWQLCNQSYNKENGLDTLTSVKNNKDRGDGYENALPKDVTTTLESLGEKIQRDVNEMFTKLKNQCKLIPQMKISSSSICQVEDEESLAHEVTWTYSQDFSMPNNIL